MAREQPVVGVVLARNAGRECQSVSTPERQRAYCVQRAVARRLEAVLPNPDLLVLVEEARADGPDAADGRERSRELVAPFRLPGSRGAMVRERGRRLRERDRGHVSAA